MNNITPIFLSLILVSAPLTGCAGRAANPISTILPGDSNLNCFELVDEMSMLDADARRKYGREAAKTGKNIGLGVAGAFFLVPLFFMDFSAADRLEAEAMQDRYRHLQRLSRRQQCEF